MAVVKGILFDLSGVLYIGDRPIEGAVKTVTRLMERMPVRFVTNTTRQTPQMLAEKLRAMGFEIPTSYLFSALAASAAYLRERSGGAYVLADPAVADYLAPFKSDDPAYVLVADARDAFTYERLNKAFRYLMAGAELLAAAKNRYYRDGDGLSLDMGGFVALLEYASAKKAKVLGKPSKAFFELACDAMGLAPAECLMVGDDMQSDILGAARAGLLTCLVRTGKFRPEDLKAAERKPDFLIDSVADLPRVLV